MREQSWIEPDASLERDVKAFKDRYHREVNAETGELRPLRVLLLFGGNSPEHLISCRSAEYIHRGLKAAGHDVHMLGITRESEFLLYRSDEPQFTDGSWEVQAKEARESLDFAHFSPRAFFTHACDGQTPDVIFPAVHGVNNEDGILQGLLELSGIPYVGSGVLGSAIGMDKVMTKRLVQDTGIPQLPWIAIRRAAFANDPEMIIKQISQQVDFPCFVKPSNGGSSLGTAKADDEDSLRDALENAARFDSVIVVEKFINARELEVAVLGNEEPLVSDVGEIVKDEDVVYYDYKTKYFSSSSSLAIPAPVEGRLRQRIRDMARKVWDQVGAAGLSRVDFFFDTEAEEVYFNEINTLPGFTSISLYPQAFHRLEIDLPQLVNYLLALALERQDTVQRSHAAEDDRFA